MTTCDDQMAMSTENRLQSERDAFQHEFRKSYERLRAANDLLRRAKQELPITTAGRALREEIEAWLK